MRPLAGKRSPIGEASSSVTTDPAALPSWCTRRCRPRRRTCRTRTRWSSTLKHAGLRSCRRANERGLQHPRCFHWVSASSTTRPVTVRFSSISRCRVIRAGLSATTSIGFLSSPARHVNRNLQLSRKRPRDGLSRFVGRNPPIGPPLPLLVSPFSCHEYRVLCES